MHMQPPRLDYAMQAKHARVVLRRPLGQSGGFQLAWQCETLFGDELCVTATAARSILSSGGAAAAHAVAEGGIAAGMRLRLEVRCSSKARPATKKALCSRALVCVD